MTTLTGQFGEVFGSFLGKAIGNGNKLVEIGAGTILGLALGKVGDALHAGLTGDISNEVARAMTQANSDLAAQFAGAALGPDILGRLASAGSSLLVGELADALGLHGFDGQVFTAAVNGVTSQFVKNAVTSALNGTFDLQTVLGNSFNPATMGAGVASALGGVFGDYLASKVVTPKTPEAALFGAAGSAIGGLAGAALFGTAVATALFSAVPVIGPFLGPFLGPLTGAFFGKVLGTVAGNALADDDATASTALTADATGHLGQAFVSAPHGGDVRIAASLADTVRETVNSVLDSMGSRLDPNVPLTYKLGYFTATGGDAKIAYAGVAADPAHQRTFGAGTQQFEDADRRVGEVAQLAIHEILDRMQVVGGDVVMRRALDASRTQNPTFGVVDLGFDLQVAKDYRFYLDNLRLINAMIEADPESRFAAGWMVTLKRADELGLNRASEKDFKGGILAHLADRGLADKLDWTPDVDPDEPDTLLLHKLNHTVRIDNAFGPGLVKIEKGTDGTDWGTFTNAPLQSVLRYDGGAGNDFISGHRGTNILVGGAGDDLVNGNAGHDWLAGGDGNDTLNGSTGDDLLNGGAGADTLNGGGGFDVVVGGDGGDVVVVDTLAGETRVVAALKGSVNQQDVLRLAGPLDPRASRGITDTDLAASGPTRDGADLVITTRTGSWTTSPVGEVRQARDPQGNLLFDAEGNPLFTSVPHDTFTQAGQGRVVVEGFFLAKNSLDEIQFGDGTATSWIAAWDRLIPLAPNGQPIVFGKDLAGGGRTVVSIDAGRAQDWVSIVTEYAAGDVMIQQITYKDDGSDVTIFGDGDNE
ncbi:MAG TPA: hypothetical protein VF744_17315, partial [Beijerinckiaceae bacterium]